MFETPNKHQQIVKRLVGLETAVKYQNVQQAKSHITWFVETFGENYQMQIISHVALMLHDAIKTAQRED